MGEEDTVAKVGSNGTSPSEKTGEVASVKPGDKNDGMKGMEEHSKHDKVNGVKGMEENHKGDKMDAVKEMEEDCNDDDNDVAKERNIDGKDDIKDAVKEAEENMKDDPNDGVKELDEDNKDKIVESVEMGEEWEVIEGKERKDEEEKRAEKVRGNVAQEEEEKDSREVEDNDVKEEEEKEGEEESEKDCEEKDEKDSKEDEEDENGGEKANVLEAKTGLNEEGYSTEKEENREEVDGSKEEKEKEMIKGGDVLKKLGKRGSAEKVKENKKEVGGKKEKELRTPVAPAIERPVRERKTVERLVASIEKDAGKELQIEKGQGTPLKDIPNVKYNLLRKKTDRTFKLLHLIFFGRQGRAFQLKSNMLRFSGFVWRENEEKRRLKVKEKFDRCNKEKLLEICDLLDIPITKASTRKEDIVVKLIDFLVAPHATTDVLLAEKELSKGKKRKRVIKPGSSVSGGTPSKRSAKNQREMDDPSKEEKKSTAEMEDDESEGEDDENDEENENVVPERSEDKMSEPSESKEKENETEGESEDDKGKLNQGAKNLSATKKEVAEKTKTKKVATPKELSPPAKKAAKKSSLNCPQADDGDEARPRVFSRKRKNVETVEKSSTPTKSALKEKSGKRVAKGKVKPKEDKLRPSPEDLKNAICEILKEVDFNKATFTDILNQLALQFKTDLTLRKSSIKLMIQEELTKLADDEEDEVDTEKDEMQAASKGVKA